MGWGADGNTGAPAKFPIVKLTYTDAAKTFNGKREPVETENTPVINRKFAISTSRVFSTMDEYVSYVNVNFAGADPPTGTSGIYGSNFSHIFDTHFNAGTVPYGLSVETSNHVRDVDDTPIQPRC